MASRWITIGLLLVGGCSSDGSIDLLVELQTDLRPGEEFTGTRVELFRLREVGGVSTPGERLRTVSDTVGASDDFFVGQRIAELADLETGEYSVVAALTSADGSVVAERTAWLSLRETTGVLMVITRDCRDVTCLEGQTCIAGRCDDARCLGGDEGVCATAECTTSSPCPPPPGCGEPLCVSGWCLLRPDDSVCAAEQYCVPETGCVDRTMSDGGIDAGGHDGGADAGADGGPADGGTSDGGSPDGGCVEGTVCGMVEVRFDPCGFADTCTTAGTQTRTLHTPTCMDGACVIVSTMETVSCARSSTDGTTCGATTTMDSSCTRTAECGTAGTFVRTTTTRTCDAGTCDANATPAAMACTLAGMADGTPCAGGHCCSEACVPRNSNNHCGACGIDCTTEGQTCANAVSFNGGRHDLPRAWVCTCPGTNSTCVAVGYGAGATCFGGHCQCHCAGAGPITCGGPCRAGTCFEDTIEPQSDNFCGY